MRIGYQVGQVVPRGSLTLQQQRRDHLEQFRAARDAGFDLYGWGHHYLIDPFQHFQPLPALARLAAEGGTIKLATSVLLLPLLNPVDVAEQVATIDQISKGRLVLGLGARTAVRAGAVGWYGRAGLSNIAHELYGKRLELLKEAVPGLSRVAVLSNPTNPTTPLALSETRVAARSLGVTR